MFFTQGHGFVIGQSFGLPRLIDRFGHMFWIAAPRTPPLW